MLTANLKSTIKLFKAHSDNECVKAVSGILEYVKAEKACPRPYKTLLKEVKKDSPISSWLPSYSQADTKLFLSFLTGQCDIFSDLEKTTKFTHAFPFVARIISEFLSFHCERFLPPTRVQAKDRFFIFDNSCSSHKSALRRFPHRVRHWTFVIDRTHFKNHKTCFSGYNMDEFPQLKSVNSQQAEQINRSLRSLATVLAHLRWETYLKVLELYFVHRILRVKKI